MKQDSQIIIDASHAIRMHDFIYKYVLIKIDKDAHIICSLDTKQQELCVLVFR